MAPKRKGVSVNLRDLQREMGVGAAMLLPSAPKPVDEAAAERGRYGGNREGYGDRSGGGGGSGVRWADRDSDDDDEWRRDDEGQTNGVARGQRAQAPDIPDEPWRSAPRQAPAGGGEAPAGRHSSGAQQRVGGGEAAGDAEEDWAVLRSASRGVGSHGEGDRGGGARDEDVDFAEVRRGAPQQQRKQQQHQGSTASADAEDALDFASLRSTRSTDRVTRGGSGGGDDRPEHLRTLRSRLAEKAAEKLQHQQETGTAGGIRATAPQQSFETNVSSPLRTPSSGAPPTLGGTAASANRMSSLGGLGQTGGGDSAGSGRPARYIPPSKRGGNISAPASGAGTTAILNTRAAAFLEDEDEKKPYPSTAARGSSGGAPVHPPTPARQEIKAKPERTLANVTISDASSTGGATEDSSSRSGATGSVQTPGDLLKKQQEEKEKEKEGDEKEEEKVKEGHASTAPTPAATASPAAETSPGVATPVKGLPAAGENASSLLPPATGEGLANESAAAGDLTTAGGEQGMQKAIPRWKQRLEQRRREQEAAGTGAVSAGAASSTTGGSSVTTPGGGIFSREKETAPTESLLPSSGVGVPPVADEGVNKEESFRGASVSPAVSNTSSGPAVAAGIAVGSSCEQSGGSTPVITGSLSADASSRVHALQQEEVIQLQPIRLGSSTTHTKRADGGSGEGGRYIPPSLLRQQKQQHQYGGGSGGSSLSTVGKGSYPTDVQRLFLQAAANSAGGTRGGRSQATTAGGGEGGEKAKTGVSGGSGQDAVVTTAGAESEEKNKKQRKRDKKLERERQRQEALLKERERQEKLWKHDENQVQTFVQLLEKTLADQAAGAESKQQPSTEQQSQKKVEDDAKKESEKEKDKEGETATPVKDVDILSREEVQEERKLVLSDEEGGILNEDTLKGMVPCIVVAAALMKRCMQKKDMEQVREEVQKASYLWKELLQRSQVDEKDQILIKEMARAVKAVKCPRLSPSVSLIEALWDAMVATNVLPDTAFIKWFEDTRDESEGRTEVLFQVLDWCLWLQGDLMAPNERVRQHRERVEEDLEDEAEDDVDVEALVPKRGGQRR